MEIQYSSRTAITEAASTYAARTVTPSARRPAGDQGRLWDCSKSGLLVVAFVHTWSPPAMHVARNLEQLTADGLVSFASVLFADPDADAKLTAEFGQVLIPPAFRLTGRSTGHAGYPLELCSIVATPAIVVYRNGQPVRFQRPDREDDVKCTLSFSTAWTGTIGECVVWLDAAFRSQLSARSPRKTYSPRASPSFAWL